MDKFAKGGIVSFDKFELPVDVGETIIPTERLKKILGVDDIVQVVRCKDCKYCDNGECTIHSEPANIREYERWTVDVDENDFCSYGERKDNA